jgi:hypothetical protein
MNMCFVQRFASKLHRVDNIHDGSVRNLIGILNVPPPVGSEQCERRLVTGAVVVALAVQLDENLRVCALGAHVCELNTNKGEAENKVKRKSQQTVTQY